MKRKPAAEMDKDTGDISAYCAKLRTYSTEELEDIYYHIEILEESWRYRALITELEARRLRPADPPPPAREFDLAAWLASRPRLARRPTLRACLLVLLVLAASTLVTLGLLAPIWFFAMPLGFLGIQTAIVYFACAPVAPIMGVAVGAKLGRRGLYRLPALLGALLALLLFNATGAPSAILRSLLERGTGGPSFPAF